MGAADHDRLTDLWDRHADLVHAVVFCDVYHLVGLDLTSGKWRRFPSPPDALPRSVTWTGHELLAFTDQHLLALEPAAK